MQKLIGYTIELICNFGKLAIQVQCLDADFISTHHISIVRLYCFVRLGIQQHTGYFSTQYRFVFYIGEEI